MGQLPHLFTNYIKIFVVSHGGRNGEIYSGDFNNRKSRRDNSCIEKS